MFLLIAKVACLTRSTPVRFSAKFCQLPSKPGVGALDRVERGKIALITG